MTPPLFEWRFHRFSRRGHVAVDRLYVRLWRSNRKLTGNLGLANMYFRLRVPFVWRTRKAPGKFQASLVLGTRSPDKAWIVPVFYRREP